MAGMEGRRTLRSGKEFSMYDLAIGQPIQPPQYFSVADCLKQRLEAQEITKIYDEPANIMPPPPPPPPSLPPSPVLLPSFPPYTTPRPFWQKQSRDLPAKLPSTSLDAKKLGSKRRKREKRELEASQSEDPDLKGIHRIRRDFAKSNAIQVDLDATDLPHSKPAWIGKRNAQDGSEAPEVGSISPSSSSSPGMGGTVYTQEELDALSGTEGFQYVNWLGEISIPIIDSHRRLIALLGGKPKDLVEWKRVTDTAAELMSNAMERGHFTDDDCHHRRAHEDAPYPLVSRGMSHGGGQTEPGELCNNKANTEITDELLAHESFQRISGFTNCLVRVFGPLLFAFYVAQLAILSLWKPNLRWPFPGSIFAACTFNFGPYAITRPHLDFGNLSWGWCAITALGWFDPDIGGHLILWDLKLIIRFPPGATILIPSAIIRHSNIPIRTHERRFSFTQYTAGGLFRWIRNGCKTDYDFEMTATPEQKSAREAEAATRWDEGVKMFSIIDDL
ncbi:hypothetical protein B0H11DRAFT_2365602 [Mycena galericulata]|nr:hypothetical protein B0H11DRAFT_2365602 [Mycena galericulata]